MPSCPICRKRLKWTGSSSDHAVYTCAEHGDFHRHFDNSEYMKNGKPDHDHDGKTHV